MAYLCTLGLSVTIGLAVTFGALSAHDPPDSNPGEPIAETLLKALQRKRPINEVIPPASATDGSARPARRALLPEGTAVVDRSGRITFDGRWWKYLFDPAKGEPPTKLLPNAGLEVMVRTATGAGTPVKFVVSGEMTVFEQENYLLVRVVRREVVMTGRPLRPGPPGKEPAAAREDTTPVNHEHGRDEKPPGRSPSADPPPEDVLAMLQQQQPQAVIQALPSPANGRPTRDAMLAPRLRPDGSPLVHRPGRIVRDGDWWTYVFESDNPAHADPKVKLLPNKSVDLMVQASKRGNNGLVFIVSGDVTLFQNENFLLPHIAIRRIDKGNLRK